MMRVPYETMLNEFKRVLIKKGFKEDRAEAAATIFAQNSLSGVYSHGLNRFPRVVEYLEKGEIDPDIVGSGRAGTARTRRKSLPAPSALTPHRAFPPCHVRCKAVSLLSGHGL